MRERWWMLKLLGCCCVCLNSLFAGDFCFHFVVNTLLPAHLKQILIKIYFIFVSHFFSPARNVHRWLQTYDEHWFLLFTYKMRFCLLFRFSVQADLRWCFSADPTEVQASKRNLLRVCITHKIVLSDSLPHPAGKKKLKPSNTGQEGTWAIYIFDGFQNISRKTCISLKQSIS